MSPCDLSFLADALLALCEKPPGRPFYTEEGMRLKLKQAERREPIYGHLLQLQDDDLLLRQECTEVFRSAKLTARQEEVLLRRLEGWTFEEIGGRTGHSRQSAQHIFVQALKKIARAFRVYPWRGLAEVYRWETRRGLARAGSGKIPQSAT